MDDAKQIESQDSTRDVDSILMAISELCGVPLEEVSLLYEDAQKGKSIAEMFKIPKESLEAGYALATSLYSSGRYKDAEVMFYTLCQYEENNPKNWLGWGCCLEKRGLYPQSVFCFARAADLATPLNPKPLYLLAVCCCNMKEFDAARKALSLAVDAGDEKNTADKRYRSLSKDLLDSIAAA